MSVSLKSLMPAALVGVASMTFTLRAQAQPALRDPAAAEALFKKGVELLKADDWKGACPNFESSMKLDPSVGTQINIARCALHDGKLALGWAELKKASTLNQDTPGAQRKREIQTFIDDETAKVEPRLPWLTLELRDKPEGLTVTRDGVAVPIDSIGTAVPVDPGKHVIRVDAPGYQPASIDVELAEATRKTVKLELTRSPGAPIGPVVGTAGPVRPVASASESGSNLLVPLGATFSGVGGGLLLTSLVTGLLSNADLGDVDALSSDPQSGCSLDAATNQLRCASSAFAAADETASRGETLALVSTVTLFAGIAFAGAGVPMLIVGATESDAAPSVAIVPLLSPTHAGVSFGGAF